MKPTHSWTRAVAGAACLAVVVLAGCRSLRSVYERPQPAPLGALSDPVWQNQELNAEMSDFVVYQHEFERGSARLTTDGEDHVKQIAARLSRGQDARVAVERSMTSAREGTKHQYPVHPNPELDLRRRQVVARSLAAMGIGDADDRVLVAPALAEGLTGNEAEAAYLRGLRGNEFGTAEGGFGGFLFGGGGFF